MCLRGLRTVEEVCIIVAAEEKAKKKKQILAT